MLGFNNWVRAVFIGLCVAGAALAQPALTTISDVLYKADGARFNGAVLIQWNNFQAGDGTTVATQQVNLRVINGILSVRLVPTTTASAGASYTVIYNSGGNYQYTETWAVPPSAAPLRVYDVRVAQGTVVGTPIASAPILISDVSGLAGTLSALAPEGTGFAPSRAAVINSSAQIDAASGTPGDCLHVDGSSGPCGSVGGSGPGFVDNEVPGGIINGTNITFTLANVPSPAASLAVFVNGILLKQNFDYTLSGNTISFQLPSTPQPGDTLVASYRLADPNNPGNAAAAQVLCSATGIATGSTTPASLGTCTIPAGMLHNGDRIDIRFNFSHEGTSTGATTQVLWGGTTAFTRTVPANETLEVGQVNAGVNPAGTMVSADSWGAVLAPANGVAVANDSISSAITIRFLGQLASAATDTVTLRNFTVIRYPAIVNP